MLRPAWSSMCLGTLEHTFALWEKPGLTLTYLPHLAEKTFSETLWTVQGIKLIMLRVNNQDDFIAVDHNGPFLIFWAMPSFIVLYLTDQTPWIWNKGRIGSRWILKEALFQFNSQTIFWDVGIEPIKVNAIHNLYKLVTEGLHYNSSSTRIIQLHYFLTIDPHELLIINAMVYNKFSWTGIFKISLPKQTYYTFMENVCFCTYSK